MPGFSPFLQSVLYGVITKSVGSVFRVKDDWQAPPEIRKNTIKREGILLALTTGFTTMTQSIFSGAFGKTLERNPKLKQYELLLRAGFTAIGIFMAEATSRATAPKTSWADRQAAQAKLGENDGPKAQGDVFQRRDAVAPVSPMMLNPGVANSQAFEFPARPTSFSATPVATPVILPSPATMAVPALVTTALRQVARMPIRVPLTFSQSVAPPVTTPVMAGRFPL